MVEGRGRPGDRTAGTAGRRTRRGRPGYDRESLLRVAVGLFNERGFDGTSMDDLARELGVTKAAIYHHVPGKQELLRLAVDRALDGLFALVGELDSVPGRAVDRLEHLVRGSVTVLVDRLPFVTLLLRVRGNTQVERDALERRREFDRIVAGLVADAVADGDLRSDVDPATTARLLFGMVNSLIEWYRPHGGDIGGPDLADAVTKVAFDGLRPRPAA
ncbi:TetR/AcrR family transcriptional regulator [Actinoallomurus spadix]|uniref:TetR/AcrR family transcriptional regulator n=1 Tax=Actinoallomurus spadix TaxID=79912 RepID=A0ABP3H341_9ACTN|nr:TetR/AcrR family transcriptional regulator [Actinoallomurus spadix]MCO5988710.1 TetR/AcrR family transcriptional regulator [Actinoallomurus spadix]